MKLCGMFPHSARKSREGGSRARPFQSPIVGHSACGSTPPTFPRVGAHRACVRPRPGVPKGAEPPLRGLGCPNPSGGRVGIRGHANGRGAGNSGRMKRPCAAEPDRGAGAFHRPCPPPRAGGCCPRTSSTLTTLHPTRCRLRLVPVHWTGATPTKEHPIKSVGRQTFARGAAVRVPVRRLEGEHKHHTIHRRYAAPQTSPLLSTTQQLQ